MSTSTKQVMQNKDIYIMTKLNQGTNGEVVRTIIYNKGGIHVGIDFNRDREVIGVEVLDVKSVAVNGEQI